MDGVWPPTVSHKNCSWSEEFVYVGIFREKFIFINVFLKEHATYGILQLLLYICILSYLLVSIANEVFSFCLIFFKKKSRFRNECRGKDWEPPSIWKHRQSSCHSSILVTTVTGVSQQSSSPSCWVGNDKQEHSPLPMWNELLKQLKWRKETLSTYNELFLHFKKEFWSSCSCFHFLLGFPRL